MDFGQEFNYFQLKFKTCTLATGTRTGINQCRYMVLLRRADLYQTSTTCPPLLPQDAQWSKVGEHWDTGCLFMTGTQCQYCTTADMVDIFLFLLIYIKNKLYSARE